MCVPVSLAAALAVWLGPCVVVMVAVAAGAALAVQVTPARRVIPTFGWALSVVGLGLVATGASGTLLAN